jgi:hypothetical protein
MPRNADRPPDIEIGATVRAKKLRFERVPETEVRTADGSRPKSRRKNLPDRVEPGVTYRDAEVSWSVQTNVIAQDLAKEQGRNDS